MKNYDLILKNGLVHFPDRSEQVDVLIKDQTIKGFERNSKSNASKTLDLSGQWVFPGLIDDQVHFREPGLTHKEDLHTGSKSCAAGGITTFLEMPNTKPSTTTVSAIREKISLAQEKSLVDFGFYIGATRDNLDELIKAEKEPGCCGIKIFLGSSTGDLLLYDPDILEKIFIETKLPIAIHSENEILLQKNIEIHQKSQSVHDHYRWRSVEVAASSTQMILELAQKTKRKIHLLHISTAEELDLIRRYRDYCTFEILPQHLYLAAPEDYERLGTLAQMNPPIREKSHQAALWKALNDHEVDIMGSDHAPHTLEEKQRGYPQSPSGMPGAQTLFPLMLHAYLEKRIELKTLFKVLVSAPIGIFSLKNKGHLQVDKDADFVVIDPNKNWDVKRSDILSKSGWSPFEGMSLKGKIDYTFVRGFEVYNSQSGVQKNSHFQAQPIAKGHQS